MQVCLIWVPYLLPWFWVWHLLQFQPVLLCALLPSWLQWLAVLFLCHSFCICHFLHKVLSVSEMLVCFSQLLYEVGLTEISLLLLTPCNVTYLSEDNTRDAWYVYSMYASMILFTCHGTMYIPDAYIWVHPLGIFTWSL